MWLHGSWLSEYLTHILLGARANKLYAPCRSARPQKFWNWMYVYLNNWRLPENWPSVWWPSAWLNDYLPEYLAVYLTHWQSVWITDRLFDPLTVWIYDCMTVCCMKTWLTYVLFGALANKLYDVCPLQESKVTVSTICREIILAKPALFLFYSPQECQLWLILLGGELAFLNQIAGWGYGFLYMFTYMY